jgi:hypothetical protein
MVTVSQEQGGVTARLVIRRESEIRRESDDPRLTEVEVKVTLSALPKDDPREFGLVSMAKFGDMEDDPTPEQMAGLLSYVVRLLLGDDEVWSRS